MAHPLNGADLGTLVSGLRQGGAPSAAKLPTYAGCLLSALARAPISGGEALALRATLPKLDDIPPPIFILGHWRSGTTHLYNVMSKARFGYLPPVLTGLPWDMFGIARTFRGALEKALPEHRHIDRIPVTAESPQEDEIALANMTALSFYHAIYFPRDFNRLLRRGLFFEDCRPEEIAAWRETFTYFTRKLAFQQGKQLLIKNPVYTGRVAMLRQIFPTAKFVHIHRNPFDVFLSMRNFYAKLLPVLALQSYEHVDIDAAVLSVYSEMMTRFEAETADLRAPDFIEIAYDALDADGLGTIRRIFETLELDGYEAAAPTYAAYLSSVKSFEKNAFRGDAEAIEKVSTAWASQIEKWGYATPTPAKVASSAGPA